MTEAFQVVDSLRAAASQPILSNESSLTLNKHLTQDRGVIPLKLALFNLQKYCKEGDFAAEFMLKGGLITLVSMLERVHGGLTGNALAVSHPDAAAVSLGANETISMLCKACEGYWNSSPPGPL